MVTGDKAAGDKATGDMAAGESASPGLDTGLEMNICPRGLTTGELRCELLEVAHELAGLFGDEATKGVTTILPEKINC